MLQNNHKNTHLSVVASAAQQEASQPEINMDGRKVQKRVSFDGFSEADKATTKSVQKLYFQKFSSRRIPQDEVASQVNWSQSTLNLYINGKQRIGDTALRKFCVLLNVSPEDISETYKETHKKVTEGKSKELESMKEILADLVDAVNGKRDIGMIVMRAKKIVNS